MNVTDVLLTQLFQHVFWSCHTNMFFIEIIFGVKEAEIEVIDIIAHVRVSLLKHAHTHTQKKNGHYMSHDLTLLMSCETHSLINYLVCH